MPSENIEERLFDAIGNRARGLVILRREKNAAAKLAGDDAHDLVPASC